MPKNPPEGMPRITPYLLYEDVGAALNWLSRAFGLQETLRYEGENGLVNHAEMRLQDGVVMMGCPGPEYRSAKSTGHGAQQVHVYVDDVDAHFAHARATGATIVAEPRDQRYGDRRYDTEDPEGNRWSFATHIRDVAPEDWGAG